MAVGSITTTTGRGVRAVNITVAGVGGGRRSLRFTFRLAITFAGIRSPIITAIHVRGIAAATIIDFARFVPMRSLVSSESIRRTTARSQLKLRGILALMALAGRERRTTCWLGERSMLIHCARTCRSDRLTRRLNEARVIGLNA